MSENKDKKNKARTIQIYHVPENQIEAIKEQSIKIHGVKISFSTFAKMAIAEKLKRDGYILE